MIEKQPKKKNQNTKSSNPYRFYNDFSRGSQKICMYRPPKISNIETDEKIKVEVHRYEYKIIFRVMSG